eukprot:COSAG04_NODE_16993_length_482_cov_1.838120_1_plen_32_part_10
MFSVPLFFLLFRAEGSRRTGGSTHLVRHPPPP